MKLPQHTKRVVCALTTALALTTAPAAAAAPASAASAYSCETQWGSLVKQRAPYTSKQIRDVRAGRHHCFDRLVIDLGGTGRGRLGYQVRFVTTVTMDGSGAPVALRGGAQLRVIIKAPAYDDSGSATYGPASWTELVDVRGYRTFRQVSWAGTHEGQTTIGLGVRARLPMRVFVLTDSGGRYHLVVDVAHAWS